VIVSPGSSISEKNVEVGSYKGFFPSFVTSMVNDPIFNVAGVPVVEDTEEDMEEDKAPSDMACTALQALVEDIIRY